MSTSVIRWIGLIGAVCIWADTATAQSRTLLGRPASYRIGR